MLNYLLGNQCFICEKDTSNRFFCDDCIKKLNTMPEKNFIKYNDNYYFNKVFPLFENNETLKKIIHLYKFGNIRSLDGFFSSAIKKRYDSSFFDDYDFFVYVPLHEKKLKKRGFNQVERILKKLIKEEKIFNGVKRIKNTRQQSLIKNRQERKKNLFNAFEIEKNKIKLLKDKKILLFDDIFTTGTTLNELAKPFFYSMVKKIDIMIIGVT